MLRQSDVLSDLGFRVNSRMFQNGRRLRGSGGVNKGTTIGV